jgi:uncharacterized integral membrane protein
LARLLRYVLAIPIALVLITLAVINRHDVRLVLDPFRPDHPALALVLPFYAYVLGALIVGVVLGGLAAWIGQSRWRRLARARTVEARRWQVESGRGLAPREARGSAELTTANR